MARSFGSTGASSLLRASESALNKVNTYNDAAAAYEFDLSAKTSEDYQKYSDYLNKRVASTQNTDPSKALSLQRTATSANRTFNSAEINRASTQVKYGDMSNRDKYAQMSKLWQAASANGDDNLAQSLEGQMASLSVTIQNEDIAAQNAADAAGKKADAATKRGFDQRINMLDDGIKKLNAAKLSGQISPADYNDRMRQLYLGSENQPGIISLTQQAQKVTGDENGAYQSKLDGFAADRKVQSFVNGTAAAQGSAGNLFGQTIVKNPDGTYGFHDRPASEITGNVPLKDKSGNVIKDAAGHVITSPVFAAPQAFTDSKGNINGFQYATNLDQNTGQPAPGTGAGAIRQIGKADINTDDPSGVPYFINEAGQKKFIGKDPTNGKAIMANDPSIIKGQKFDAGTIGDLPIGNPFSGAFWSNAADLGSKVIPKTGKILSSGKNIPGVGPFLSLAGNALSGLFARNDQAQQAIAAKALQDRVAAQNAARDAATLAASRRILPVFQPPPPPAPPKITPKPSQYNLPPLPAPVPLGNTGIKVPSSTGNYNKDVLNLGRSLGGLM